MTVIIFSSKYRKWACAFSSHCYKSPTNWSLQFYEFITVNVHKYRTSIWLLISSNALTTATIADLKSTLTWIECKYDVILTVVTCYRHRHIVFEKCFWYFCVILTFRKRKKIENKIIYWCQPPWPLQPRPHRRGRGRCCCIYYILNVTTSMYDESAF